MVLDGTYRLVKIIGRGGMGEVWRARHERLPKEVAVKFLLHLQLLGEQDANRFRARFRREAEIASRLEHPNIVDVLDFNVLPSGVPYMVLELLRGESLRARLDRGPLSADECRSLVRQVGSALAAAHALGGVHRDRKPENLFLGVEPGETGTVIRAKVLDFGISKMAGDTVLTLDREVLGTPYYMAPEQAAGRREEVDGRADQFALACIAYEALAGRRPFWGGTITEIIGHILHAEPVPLSEVAPHLPASLWPVLDRALAKRPQDRYPDITAFVEAFSESLDGHGRSAAGSSGASASPGEPAVSQEALASADTVVSQDIGSRGRQSEGQGASQVQGPVAGSSESTEQAATAPASSRTGRLGLALGAVAASALLAGLSVWFFSRRDRGSDRRTRPQQVAARGSRAAPGVRPTRASPARPRPPSSRSRADSGRSSLAGAPGPGPARPGAPASRPAGGDSRASDANATRQAARPAEGSPPGSRTPRRATASRPAPRQRRISSGQGAARPAPRVPASSQRHEWYLEALERARKAFAAGRYAEAAEWARKATIQESRQAAWVLRVKALCAHGKWQDAKAYFHRIRGARRRKSVRRWCRRHGIGL